jgi:DNA-binding SARP family transcriptional activator
LLSTYGDRALTHLRRLLDDPDTHVRQQARLALLAVKEATDLPIVMRSFQGMYIECLGRVRAHIGSRELQEDGLVQQGSGRAGWQKVQGTLAYMVHCGARGASREALAQAVWGEAWSASSVARTLTALRQTFECVPGGEEFAASALTIDAEFCRLDPEFYHSDVRAFERIFTLATQHDHEEGLDAAAPLYGQTLALYNGAYMADVPRAARWGRERRDYLMGSYVIAAERLAEHHFNQRAWSRCVEACMQALDADPAAEDAMIWMLRAYSAAGMRAEREQAFRSYLRVAGGSALEVGAPDDDPVVRVYHQLTAAGA